MSETAAELFDVIATDEYGPILFYDFSKHGFVIAKGRDGALYQVVSAPDGWQRRSVYNGCQTALCRISRAVAVPLARRLQAGAGSSV